MRCVLHGRRSDREAVVSEAAYRRARGRSFEMAITRTPSARVEEGAGPLGRGFGAPQPRDGAPAIGAMERKYRGAGSEPPAQSNSTSHVRGGEPLHAVRERGRGGEHVGHAGGCRGRVHPRGDARRSRARAAPRSDGARERHGNTGTGAARREAREKVLARGMSVDSGLDLSARARRQNPRGASRDTRSSCARARDPREAQKSVDATRVSGHPRAANFSPRPPPPRCYASARLPGRKKRDGDAARPVPAERPD